MCGAQVSENPLHGIPPTNEEASTGAGVRAAEPDPEAGEGEGQRQSISESLDVAAAYPRRASVLATRDNPALTM